MHINFPNYIDLEFEARSFPFSKSDKIDFEFYESIFPVFKPLPYLGTALIDAVFLHQRISEELYCFYAIRHSTGYEIVHHGHLETWGVRKNELFRIAMDNMRKQIVGNLEIHGDAEGMMFTMNGEFEAGLLMIDEIWEQLEEQTGDQLVISVPSRGVLVACGKSNFKASNPLQMVVKSIFRESDAPLSDKWFIRSEGQWSVFNA
jgi:uncharacterized protein YtpQ (UPF0354 family)